MRAVVIYESWYGNTRKVAEAIAAGLGGGSDVVVCSVDDPSPALGELDLLVVGGPTHVHGLSSERSRSSAIEHGAEVSEPGIGVRGWLAELPEGDGKRAAAFDTRLDKPVLLVGSAARGIGKRLERRGWELVAEPESFFVESDERTPLAEGELERAEAWGRALAGAVPTPVGN
jgi:hypothetical protein